MLLVWALAPEERRRLCIRARLQPCRTGQ